MIKQAIIPLAGLGTRLLPLTSVFPKELLPINGKPGIEYILDECIDAGIKEIIFIISNKKKIKGNFYTHKPTQTKPSSWSFKNTNTRFSGEAILLKGHEIWHPYQTKIKSYEVNKVHFSGLSSKLSKVTNEKDLLKATSGFFKIGSGCYGGRIKKG